MRKYAAWIDWSRRTVAIYELEFDDRGHALTSYSAERTDLWIVPQESAYFDSRAEALVHLIANVKNDLQRYEEMQKVLNQVILSELESTADATEKMLLKGMVEQ